MKPPHLIRKEELEGVKWTKKPGFIGPNGYGPDRKLQKLQRRQYYNYKKNQLSNTTVELEDGFGDFGDASTRRC